MPPPESGRAALFGPKNDLHRCHFQEPMEQPGTAQHTNNTWTTAQLARLLNLSERTGASRISRYADTAGISRGRGTTARWNLHEAVHLLIMDRLLRASDQRRITTEGAHHVAELVDSYLEHDERPTFLIVDDDGATVLTHDQEHELGRWTVEAAREGAVVTVLNLTRIYTALEAT